MVKYWVEFDFVLFQKTWLSIAGLNKTKDSAIHWSTATILRKYGKHDRSGGRPDLGNLEVRGSEDQMQMQMLAGSLVIPGENTDSLLIRNPQEVA